MRNCEDDLEEGVNSNFGGSLAPSKLLETDFEWKKLIKVEMARKNLVEEGEED